MNIIRRSGASADEPVMGSRGLKRSLGIWMATALVVGNMIGSGIFNLPASLAAEAGPISIISWVFTGAGAILLALVFANLATAYPRTGGPYAYSRRAFGDFIGFQTAWGYWIAVWAGNAAIATSFVGYTATFWPELDNNGWLAVGLASATIWLLTNANAIGARHGGWVQLVTTILKFVPLLVIGVIGLFYIKGGNFTPFAPYHESFGGRFDNFTTAATLTLWAFIGLESASVPAEEVRNPRKTLARATIYGTIAATAVYILATVAIMGVMSTEQLAGSNRPFADAAGIIFGGSWDKVIAVVAMISTFGALNGWILLQGRVPLAAAEDGLFPKSFARVSGKRGTPIFGLVVSSVLVTGLMAMNYNSSVADIFTEVILLATLTTLVPYAFSAAAGLIMFFRDRELFSGRKLVRDSVIAGLAFLYSFWTIYGSGQETVFKGFLLLTAGIPVYVWLKWRQSRSGDGVAVEPKPARTEPSETESAEAPPELVGAGMR